MRAAIGPTARALDGTAEAMPLPDDSADAVTVGQAFHWFDGPKALAEIERVLRPGGALALAWNRRPSESSDAARAISELIAPYRGDAPAHASGAWRDAFAGRELTERQVRLHPAPGRRRPRRPRRLDELRRRARRRDPRDRWSSACAPWRPTGRSTSRTSARSTSGALDVIAAPPAPAVRPLCAWDPARRAGSRTPADEAPQRREHGQRRCALASGRGAGARRPSACASRGRAARRAPRARARRAAGRPGARSRRPARRRGAAPGRSSPPACPASRGSPRGGGRAGPRAPRRRRRRPRRGPTAIPARAGCR